MEEADLLYLGLSTDAHGSSSLSILVPFFSRATSLVTRHDLEMAGPSVGSR